MLAGENGRGTPSVLRAGPGARVAMDREFTAHWSDTLPLRIWAIVRDVVTLDRSLSAITLPTAIIGAGIRVGWGRLM